MNSESEKIKNECLDGMDFERILEIYNLYIDVNQPCDFHKLASISSAIEQWTLNLRVTGLNPVWSTLRRNETDI